MNALNTKNTVTYAAKFELGKETYSVISMQNWLKNGNDLKEWIINMRKECYGDIPDLYRQVLYQLIVIVAGLHNKGLFLGCFG